MTLANSKAPTGRKTTAQGNALGNRTPMNLSPQGAVQFQVEWEITTIGEIAEINPRLGKSDIDDDTLASFVPMKCVEAESGRCVPPENKKVAEVKKGYTPMQDGDVIMAKVTPCMENGKAAVMRGLKNGIGFGSTEFYVLRPSAKILPDFLFYFIIQQSFRREAERHMTGAVGLRRVPRHFIENHTIPLPPLSEQRRIVARIEELFSRLDAGVAALRHAKAQLQRYRQSVLAAAVTGSLPGLQPIPPEAWRPISDVIKTLDQGWSPKCESNSAESEDEWAVIKTTAIQAGFFLDYENKKLPGKLEPRGHLELKFGDLLLTRAGPRSRVGVACYVRKVRPKLMLCDKAYRVRLEPKKATPGFIELVLNSPRFVDALDVMKSGISDSGLNLTQKRFAELLIPLPPLAEQHQIVAEVEARTTAIDHLEAELDRQIIRANRLRQSTLQSAFLGQL
jgi:type I restriction enzyme S subunit